VLGELSISGHILPYNIKSDLPAGTAGSGDLAYTSNDYASYNLSGGVSTVLKAKK
jgi:hypothetical protein